jgi:hypothetical protein
LNLRNLNSKHGFAALSSAHSPHLVRHTAVFRHINLFPAAAALDNRHRYALQMLQDVSDTSNIKVEL